MYFLGLNSKYMVIKLIVLLSPLSFMSQAEPLELKNQFKTELYIADKNVPWGMAWLPNGDMLITIRSGQLKIVKKGEHQSKNISGLPNIATGGQGGLLDIVIHPEYANNGWIYFSYSITDSNRNKSTAVMRAKLRGMQLIDQEELYVADAYNAGGRHFGSRLAFDNQGYLYFSIGDRGQRDLNPQDINRDAGKVYRLHDDGKIPSDNPFVKNESAKKAIFSYGHRNPQGMAKHPITGEIWIHEHGPRGGDEVNLIGKGKNYGWPLVSYGVNYSGTRFTDLTEKKGMVQPVWHWTPSIAPSGMAFVTSDKYPSLKGNMLVGSLKFGQVIMLKLDGDQVTNQEIVKEQLVRVRNIKQGPDGIIYIAIDGQGIFKLLVKDK
ncbi:PQQ-dependent sugar dehydrogenase [Pseudoalteromonas denitrificans]|uniref:Glucose/arabinose dehydrogenase, beta-propeller fold n=1 Tax=Pseudoalteromonas denitrificans DSM 6059 TaxID=1123010 RepID=A0A1I1IFJ7_9GAMM|nr:PQQ-dependent sugar dehydrogenase [Pseudoalteromonas denitrificans]SFC34945.1 Glucose/arabinose dehydrogenase, beta-propeller fold [Pseudoalteromonas denitrificans DSM 6059]